jgi:hypothetical protein
MGILDKFRLDGEVAVVTGAGKGIGGQDLRLRHVLKARDCGIGPAFGFPRDGFAGPV